MSDRLFVRLCETSALKRLFEDDDIDIPSLGLGVDGNPNKKTALFLVMPDNDQSFNFLISMFYTQLFDVLIRIADHAVRIIYIRVAAELSVAINNIIIIKSIVFFMTLIPFVFSIFLFPCSLCIYNTTKNSACQH